jgi:hypothetical protein
MHSPPASIADAVSRELLGERVLWAASPDRWAYASRYWKTALFGIPFAAFAIFWTYQVSHIPAKGGQGFAVFFPLWGLMFAVVRCRVRTCLKRWRWREHHFSENRRSYWQGHTGQRDWVYWPAGIRRRGTGAQHVGGKWCRLTGGPSRRSRLTDNRHSCGSTPTVRQAISVM